MRFSRLAGGALAGIAASAALAIPASRLEQHHRHVRWQRQLGLQRRRRSGDGGQVVVPDRRPARQLGERVHRRHLEQSCS